MNKGDSGQDKTGPIGPRGAPPAATGTGPNSPIQKQTLEEILARSRVQNQPAANKKMRVIEQEYDESTKRQQIQLDRLLKTDQEVDTEGKEVLSPVM